MSSSSSSSSSSPASLFASLKDRAQRRPIAALGGLAVAVSALSWIFWGSWRWRDVLVYGLLVGGLLPGLVPRPSAPEDQPADKASSSAKGVDTQSISKDGEEGATGESRPSTLSPALPGAMFQPSPSSELHDLPEEASIVRSQSPAQTPDTPPAPDSLADSVPPAPPSPPAKPRVQEELPSTTPSPAPPPSETVLPLQPAFSNSQAPSRTATMTSTKDLKSPSLDSEQPSGSRRGSSSVSELPRPPRRSSGAFHRLEAGVRETKKLLKRVKGNNGKGSGSDDEEDKEQRQQEEQQPAVVETLNPGAIPIDVYRNALARARSGEYEDDDDDF